MNAAGRFLHAVSSLGIENMGKAHGSYTPVQEGQVNETASVMKGMWYSNGVEVVAACLFWKQGVAVPALEGRKHSVRKEQHPSTTPRRGMFGTEA